ncbi:MAG TPA: Uma2 family endonuclease, partial [Thermomicrobiales bacterium]|nr:Uma2 family endonuclease [Thermomicrobiales bacterium]
KPVTIEDYEALGEDAPYELIRGELYEVAATKFIHMAVAGAFATWFGVYSVQTLPGRVLVGEGGFFLETNPDSLIIPDVAFIRAERMPPPKDRRDWARIPPDVAVEVKSPSNTRREIERKVEVYLAAGVRLVLVADTDRKTITAHTKDGQVRVYRVGEDLDGGDALPGFRVPVAAFFE